MSYFRTEDAGPGTSTRDAWRTDAVEEARLRFIAASQAAWRQPLASSLDLGRRADFLAVAAGANNQGQPDIRLPGPNPMDPVDRGPFPPDDDAEKAAEAARKAFKTASQNAWRQPLSSALDRLR